MFTLKITVAISGLFYVFLLSNVYCNKDARRLIEDLLVDYNKLVRPVDNKTNVLVVRFKLKLAQLLDVVSSYILCLFKFVSLKLEIKI